MAQLQNTCVTGNLTATGTVTAPSFAGTATSATSISSTALNNFGGTVCFTNTFTTTGTANLNSLALFSGCAAFYCGIVINSGLLDTTLSGCGIRFSNVATSAAPSLIANGAGTMWYDCQTGKMNYYFSVPDGWSLGGNLITARRDLGGVGASNTTGLAFGGQSSYQVTQYSCTEKYNGTSWSGTGAMIKARAKVAGAGTQTAGLAFGGSDGPTPSFSCTEKFNGTSWSSATGLITARRQLGGAGTQSAALAFGGAVNNPYESAVTCTEAYNGTSWTTGGAAINAAAGPGSGGTSTSAIKVAGYNFSSFSNNSCTEQYNGTSWSTSTAYPISPCGLMGVAGSSTSAVFAGGNAPVGLFTSNCFDGTTWSDRGTLSCPAYSGAAAGTVAGPIIFGGMGSGIPESAFTQKFTPGASGTCVF
jgi:hypothetical protein